MKRIMILACTLIWAAVLLTGCGQNPLVSGNNDPSQHIKADQSTDAENKDDLIPMVKLKGELYLDTGKESDIKARCGVMDGKITSTVDSTKIPEKDDESNFGSGYEYQYVDKAKVDIYMNDKWIRFEKENSEQQ